MLNHLFPIDICKIIESKLSDDYIEYKIWCENEGKMIYTFALSKSSHINCPNDNTHVLDTKNKYSISKIKSNGRILYLRKYKNNNPNNDPVNINIFDIIKLY